MSAEQKGRTETAAGKSWPLSLDTWAVTIALLAALLVRLGVIHRVPW